MGKVVPVGIPGGTVSGLEGLANGTGLVRHGEEMLYVNRDRYLLWRGCQVAPEEQSLLSWAEEHGIERAASLMRTLKDAWLVVELGGGDRRIQAARLALRLAGECVGNGGDGVPRFGVIGRAGSLVQVNAGLYDVLLRSDGVRTIVNICGEVNRLAADDSPPVLDTLFESLPVLIRAGAAGLNLSIRR